MPISRLFPLFGLILILGACAPGTDAPPPPAVMDGVSHLYALQTQPPALIRFDESFTPTQIASFELSANCQPVTMHPSPAGDALALELNCTNGALTLLIDPATGASQVIQPANAADARFLAWEYSGVALFLQINTYGSGDIIRYEPQSGRVTLLELPFLTYHMDSVPSARLSVSTRGLGWGSEILLGGESIFHDAENIISFATFAPDGERIAYIAMPDTQDAFPVGELTVLEGGAARELTPADAGHGFGPAWSPSGEQIAYITEAGAIGVFDVRDGEMRVVWEQAGARITQSPKWSANGNWLVWSASEGDTMKLWVADMQSAATPFALESPACCAAWLMEPAP